MTPAADSTVTFRMEENHDYLQLDKVTGQLWFKQDAWKANPKVSEDVVISAEKSNGAVARMTLELNVLPVDDVTAFCAKFVCFHDSVTYHAIEDFVENFKPHEVGELAPKMFGRLCKSFDVHYKLLNGKRRRPYRIFAIDRVFFAQLASQFIAIKSNKLVTAAPLNHELMSPGPDLHVAVQCEVKFGAMTRTSTKIFNISVVDRNDNLIKVQDKVTNLTLSSPYFKQVG